MSTSGTWTQPIGTSDGTVGWSSQGNHWGYLNFPGCECWGYLDVYPILSIWNKCFEGLWQKTNGERWPREVCWYTSIVKYLLVISCCSSHILLFYACLICHDNRLCQSPTGTATLWSLLGSLRIGASYLTYLWRATLTGPQWRRFSE